jgi:hypothetical protein
MTYVSIVNLHFNKGQIGLLTIAVLMLIASIAIMVRRKPKTYYYRQPSRWKNKLCSLVFLCISIALLSYTSRGCWGNSRAFINKDQRTIVEQVGKSKGFTRYTRFIGSADCSKLHQTMAVDIDSHGTRVKESKELVIGMEVPLEDIQVMQKAADKDGAHIKYILSVSTDGKSSQAKFKTLCKKQDEAWAISRAFNRVYYWWYGPPPI